MRTKLTVACALAAFVAVTGGTAEATGLIHTSGIAKGAITFDRLSPGVQKMVSVKVTTGTAGTAGTTGTNGVNGAAGLAGAAGPQGSKGDKGDAGMNGTNGTSGLKGDTGWKGDKGAPGTNGTNGTDGTNGVDAPGVVTTHVTGGDSSVCGTDWANDTYTRTLTFVPQDDGTINVIRTYDGTFTTIAGASAPSGPCNGDQVGGVTGTFTGYDVVVVTGGHFFPNATCAANCTSDAMMAAFFPGATRTINSGWEYHYDAGVKGGTWINADSVSRGGNSGNIVG